METRIAVIADYASISHGDKLNILGIFSMLYAQSTPVAHPQMVVVSQFEFEASESGKKTFTTTLIDEDGNVMFSVDQPIELQRPKDSRSMTHNQTLTLNGLVFPKFGVYEFHIVINGRKEATIPLEVVRPAVRNG